MANCVCCKKPLREGQYLKLDPYYYDDNKRNAVCVRCFKQHYASCTSCGKTYRKKEGFRSLVSTACSDACIEGLHRYGFKPPVKFIGPKVPGHFYIGMEIEVSGGSLRRDLTSIAKRTESLSGGVLYCKTDSSVTNGFEVVSLPISTYSLLNDRKIYNRFRLSSILKYFQLQGLITDESCGLHYHVGLNVFDDIKHKYRLLSLFLLNEADMFQLSGRIKKDWFRTYAGAVLHETIQDLAETGKKKERHSIIHLTGTTVEFRMFQSSLDHQRILETIMFIKGAIEFTRAFKNSKITTNPDNLLNYLHSNYGLNWSLR